MAQYSINLAAEYNAIAELKDLMVYFERHSTFIDYNETRKMLEGLILKIKEWILESVKRWAILMLSNNNVEFIL